MKNKILINFLILIIFSFGINAQTIVKLSEKGFHAKFVEDGKSIIYSTSNFQGIKKMNIETEKVDVISNEIGAGYNTLINGNKVFFGSSVNKNVVNEVNLSTKKLKKHENNNVAIIAYKNLSLGKVNNNLPVSAKSSSDLYSIDLVYSDGMINQVSTSKGKNKVWVSLSPDRTKILYTIVGEKTYVTDLKGNVITSLKRTEDPKWANNNTLVYMITKDNRDFITNSDIYVFDIKENKSFSLTSKFDDIALYPAMSADETKVVFNNDKGDLFLIQLTK